MAYSSKFLRAAFGTTAIIGCTALGVAVMSDTYAASNYTAKQQQCRIVFGNNGLVKGLKIEEASGVCICPSAQAYDIYRRKEGAEGLRCIIQGDQKKITNFNLGGQGGQGGGQGGQVKANNGWGPDKAGPLHADGTPGKSGTPQNSQTESKNANTGR